MDQVRKVLLDLGLNEKEVTIYLMLLSTGSSPASTLGQRTGITRSTAQYTCQQLLKKGIISVVQKDQTFVYSPEQPEKLKSLIEKEKLKLQQNEEKINIILGDLKSLIQPHMDFPKVRFFEGIQGIKEMFTDVLAENRIIFGFNRRDAQTNKEMLDYFEQVYIPEREKLNNPARIIYNDNDLTRQYIKHDKDINRISLLLPIEEVSLEAGFQIYGNKVAFYSYQMNDLMGVIIENKFILKTQFALFQLAWNYARHLKINDTYKDFVLENPYS